MVLVWCRGGWTVWERAAGEVQGREGGRDRGWVDGWDGEREEGRQARSQEEDGARRERLGGHAPLPLRVVIGGSPLFGNAVRTPVTMTVKE